MGTRFYHTLLASNCESSAGNVCVWNASLIMLASIRSAVLRFASESEKTSSSTPALASPGGRPEKTGSFTPALASSGGRPEKTGSFTPALASPGGRPAAGMCTNTSFGF